MLVYVIWFVLASLFLQRPARNAKDTLFCDISSYQKFVNSLYPYWFIAIRANDGTYADPNFRDNFAWCISAVHGKRLVGYLVYFVWEENWQATIATLKAQIGAKHHRRMALMIDIERWNGKITGNHSTEIRATRADLIAWLFSLRPDWQRSFVFRRWFMRQDHKRVVIYGNAGDLNTIAPGIHKASVVLAAYGSNPPFPNKLAHQFTSSGNVPPFGTPVDVNSADGLTTRQFARKLGLSTLRERI